MNEKPQITLTSAAHILAQEMDKVKSDRGRVRKIRTAMKDKSLWDGVERLAKERGLDIDREIGTTLIDDLGKPQGRDKIDARNTLLNLRASKTGRYDHLPVNNHKIEMTNNSVPDEINGIPRDALRQLAMKVAKQQPKQVALEVVHGPTGAVDARGEADQPVLDATEGQG